MGRQHADGVREAARRAHAPRQAARRGRQAAGAGEVTRCGRGGGSAADGQISPGKVRRSHGGPADERRALVGRHSPSIGFLPRSPRNRRVEHRIAAVAEPSSNGAPKSSARVAEHARSVAWRDDDAAVCSGDRGLICKIVVKSMANRRALEVP